MAEIAELFGAYQESDWAQQRALLEDLRRVSADAGSSRAMMASVVRSAAREVERSGYLTGRLHHHNAMVAAITGLAERLASGPAEHAAIAEQLRAAVTAPDDGAPPRPTGFRVLHVMPDPRGAIGEFIPDGASSEAVVRYAYVGLAVCIDLADPDAFQSHQPAYRVGNEVWPVGQLQRAGYRHKRDL